MKNKLAVFPAVFLIYRSFMERVKSFLMLLGSNLEDMVNTAGIRHALPKIAGFMFFFVPAISFTFFLKRMDGKIKKSGIGCGFEYLLKRYYKGVETDGYNIPDEGGVLLVSNHPGICDTAAILTVLKRKDLKIVVAEKPFFHSMTNLFPHLVPVDKSNFAMKNALASILGHLENRGIVLLYPAGKIEPDPEHCEDGKFLREWNGLVGYLCRKAVERGFGFRIVPIVVRNIFSAASLENPVVRLRKTKDEMEQSAFFYITAFKAAKKQRIRIDFKDMMESITLVENYGGEKQITDAVREMMLN